MARKSKKQTSKKKDSHVYQRFFERTGVMLTPGGKNRIIERIRSKHTDIKFIQYQENHGNEVWQMIIEGHDLCVVFNRPEKRIVTFLHPLGVLHDQYVEEQKAYEEAGL